MTLYVLPVGAEGEVSKAAHEAAVNEAIEARFGQIVSGVLVVGEWDAGSGDFPTARPDSSAIQVGDSWVVSGAGTVDSVSFGVTDRIIALTAGGGATFSGNWAQVKTSTLDAVPTTRTVAGGGLATGGGNLTENRTITVTAASQAQAEAGTATNVAMTPQRTKQAIDALAPVQTTGTWETGTDTAESRISAEKLKAAIEANSAQIAATGSAPLYACRAWVSFEGTTPPTIRGSGNVSGVTRASAGRYTVTFDESIQDGNYAVAATARRASGSQLLAAPTPNGTYSVTAVDISVSDATPTATDGDIVNVMIFR
jgi:hypothetical protein